MYNASEFGGGRGGATGGNSPGSKGPQGGQKSSRAPIPLRPVTIRMILEAQRVGDGALVVGGQEIGSVTVAGRVIAAEGAAGAGQGTAKSHTYHITDGSGLLTVRHWLDASQDAAAPEPEPAGSLVVATGNVKVFQDKPQLTGNVRLLHDANELTLHLLDSINVYQRFALGDRQIPGSKNKSDGPGATPATAAMGHTAPAAAAPAAGGADGQNLDAALHRVMMAADRAKGVSVAEAHAKVQISMPHVTMQEVKAKFEEMTNTGYYFPTSDGHYSY